MQVDAEPRNRGIESAPLVERIRRFMAERSLSAKEAAPHLGVTERTLVRLMAEGQPTLSRRTIDVVCLAMGIHPAELYGGKW